MGCGIELSESAVRPCNAERRAHAKPHEHVVLVVGFGVRT